MIGWKRVEVGGDEAGKGGEGLEFPGHGRRSLIGFR